MADRIYDDTKAMNLVASALLDHQDKPEGLIETLIEICEFTGRHPDQPLLPAPVVSFVLPSNGERWNWPCRDEFARAALCEVLDRANIAWGVA